MEESSGRPVSETSFLLFLVKDLLKILVSGNFFLMSGKYLMEARFSCPVIFKLHKCVVLEYIWYVYVYIHSECRRFSAGTFPADVVLNRTRVGLPEKLATRFECNSVDRFWCLRGCNNFCIHFFANQTCFFGFSTAPTSTAVATILMATGPTS